MIMLCTEYDVGRRTIHEPKAITKDIGRDFARRFEYIDLSVIPHSVVFSLFGRKRKIIGVNNGCKDICA